MALFLVGDYLTYCDYHSYLHHFKWQAGGNHNREIVYHCFWAGSMTKHHELNLKSLFITQSMPFKVCVWMPAESVSTNERFLSIMKGPSQLQIRTYIPEEEAMGTPYEKHLDILTKGGHALISDAFRTLVLFKYGGVYFDMDILFLKDLRPLCSVEFFYPWSNHLFGNSALIHFVSGNGNIEALVKRSIEKGTCHPRQLYKYAALNRLLSGVCLFPTFVFDPAWLAHDLHVKNNPFCNHFNDFFCRKDPITLADFFPASYAYHWHNRWKRSIDQGTIAGQLYEEVIDRYDKLIARTAAP